MTLRNKQSGFTIVELLIVIVVIGILAGLVIVTFTGVQQKARNDERTTDLKAIEGYVEAYNATAGKYPTLANLNDNNGDNSWVGQNIKGYKREAFRDPKSSSYSLATSPAASVYSYQVTDDNGDPCDNGASGGTDCSKFTLTATYEGGAAPLTLSGSN